MRDPWLARPLNGSGSASAAATEPEWGAGSGALYIWQGEKGMWSAGIGVTHGHEMNFHADDRSSCPVTDLQVTFVYVLTLITIIFP